MVEYGIRDREIMYFQHDNDITHVDAPSSTPYPPNDRSFIVILELNRSVVRETRIIVVDIKFNLMIL